MGFTVKNNTKIAIKREVTEGTYLAPSVGTDYVLILADGLEMTPSRETLERNVLGLGLSKIVPRQGLKSVSGSLPVEMKAASVAGAEPEYGLMLESVLGKVRSGVLVETKAAGNTASVLHIEDADIANFKVGDIVMVKEAGAFHVSPITAVVTTVGAATITLQIAAAGAFSASVEIEAFSTYYAANEDHPAFSVSKYVENAVCEKAIGAKCVSMSVESFTTGQVASFNFGFEGLNFDRILQAPQGGTPVYDTSLTPIILDACIYQDGVEIDVNEFTLSIENTLGFIQDTCNGKQSSRVTERTVSFTINPYKLDDSVAQFTKFNASTPFSLFVRAYNPTAVAGEKKEVVAFYMPHCVINEIGEADLDGVLQDTLSGSANAIDSNVSELYISFI